MATVLGTQHREHPVELGERGPGVGLDVLERLAGEVRLQRPALRRGERAAGGGGLQQARGERVPDGVVQVAGQPVAVGQAAAAVLQRGDLLLGCGAQQAGATVAASRTRSSSTTRVTTTSPTISASSGSAARAFQSAPQTR
ncbi:hypothetical protein [Blastococcus sp. TF02A-35]|uniref:hypothetical protein n=1 Tax=Blastococcus sp. TF02A-35 TaxID=2559612 RepID=UPI001FD7F768|nr:hypothetical protein [Blastococcus sp. TF02A_35]